MSHAFFKQVQQLLDQDMPFVTAVVVRAEKPTSGKQGDKAVITADGTLSGWIGGSCAQPKVIEEALKALKDGKSRFIRLSPDPHSVAPRPGLVDVAMTCSSGGTLEIYLEPQFPQPRLLVAGNQPIARALVALGKVMDYDVVVVDPYHHLADGADHVVTNLADIARFIRPDTYVVVATHGTYDEAALEVILKARPRYIGLVASHKRFEAVTDYLKSQGLEETALQRIKAPAGLDIGALQGDEIALSIMAEIVQLRRTTQAEVAIDIPVQAAGRAGIAIDPVCQMEVEIASAKYSFEYEGQTYYFCAPGCKREFSKHPQEYLSGQMQSAM